MGYGRYSRLILANSRRPTTLAWSSRYHINFSFNLKRSNLHCVNFKVGTYSNDSPQIVHVAMLLYWFDSKCNGNILIQVFSRSLLPNKRLLSKCHGNFQIDHGEASTWCLQIYNYLIIIAANYHCFFLQVKNSLYFCLNTGATSQFAWVRMCPEKMITCQVRGCSQGLQSDVPKEHVERPHERLRFEPFGIIWEGIQRVRHELSE